MWQAFTIVLREGVEAFLIVAITLAYLRKTAQNHLIGAVAWGVFGAVVASAGLGYALWLTSGANMPLWEGIFGLVTVVLVATFVVHMWKIGPKLKQDIENHLSKATAKPSLEASHLGVFLFTLIMISREGMETALLLFQVQDAAIVSGVLLGILAATAIAYLWQQFGYLINLKHFFQVTAVYLLLFTIQIAFQAFHEFTETGLLPASEALHIWSEPYSLEGYYGKLFANATVIGCGLWLISMWILERTRKASRPVMPIQSSVAVNREPALAGSAQEKVTIS